MNTTPRPDDPYTGLTQLATDQQLFVGANKPSKTGQAGTIPKKKESKHENKHASKQESKHVSKQANIQTSKHTNKQASQLANLQAFTRSHHEVKADSMVSFRCPHDLIDQIDEIRYAIRKRHGKKVTKNAILITALAFILWDYEQNDKDSVLFQTMIAQHET